MLEVPIVDAHVHLWAIPQFPRPWLSTLPALNRTMDFAGYRAQTAGMPISGMVYVETDVAPHYGLLEAQWAVALGQSDDRLAGVVAAAPLHDGLQVRAYLEALAALGPLVKGVRRNLQAEPDPAFCLLPDIVEGVRLLGNYGYSCDLCIRHEQLSAVTELVRACPSVTFVLDHLGKPPIREGRLDPWRDQLAALAALPNVAGKLSGVVTDASWDRWQPEDVALYVAHALAVLGPRRILFGSDWPVVTLATSYRQWVETVASLTSHLSADDQRLLWSDNARHWYRLTPRADS